MKIEMNIHRIEALTRQNEQDHSNFRCRISKCGLTPEAIDSIADRHLRQVSAQIDCCECGNCCKVFMPRLSPRDITRLADHLGLSEAAVIREYANEYGPGKDRFIKRAPCPFLLDNACTVYSGRPEACRAYPGLGRKGFTQNLDITFSNCSICPIVYNVYERMKLEIP